MRVITSMTIVMVVVYWRRRRRVRVIRLMRSVIRGDGMRVRRRMSNGRSRDR